VAEGEEPGNVMLMEEENMSGIGAISDIEYD